MQDINLLPDTERVGATTQHRAQLMYTVSGLVLIVFMAVMVGLFLFYTFATKQLSDIRAKQAPLEDQIKSFDTVEGRYRVVVSKTTQIQTILHSQPSFEQIVSLLLSLQSNGLNYTQVGLTAPNKVIISGSAASLPVLDSFLSQLTAKDFGRKTFSDITLQSLDRNDKGSYDFSARFIYIGAQQ